MDVGQAITEAMREDRRRDILSMCDFPSRWGMSRDDTHRMQAFSMWGWSVRGRGGLGMPGLTWPRWHQ